MTETEPTVSKDFFVSYNSADKTWAEWIAWILEENGYKVKIQAWDFLPGNNFVVEMDEAARDCLRTIAVLSDNYLQAKYTHPEWAAAFKQDPKSEDSILIPIRVGDCKPDGLLGQINYIDIVGKAETDAQSSILEGIAAALKKRAKPDQRPKFPGTEQAPPTEQRVTPEKRNFPGRVQTSNPFWPLTGAVEDQEQFFNCEKVLDRIFELLNSGSSVALIGERNLGKSSILRAVHRLAADRLEQKRQPVLLNLTRIYSEDDFYSALCEQIGIEPCNGRELDRALSQKRLLLMLDEVERIVQEEFTRRVREQLRGLAEDRDAPLKLVVAARTPLERLFPDSYDEGQVSPLEGICLEEYIQPWSPETARQFIQSRLDNTSVQFTEAEVIELIANSEGKPKQLMRLCNELYREKLQ